MAWAFLWRRYATINWAATYFAWLFAIEMVLLVMGMVRKPLSFRPRPGVSGTLGVGLFVASLALYPLLAPLQGRGWRQAEVFGLSPDPTVLATLGLLLVAEQRPPWWTLVVPLIWCLISGATLWAMASPEAWILAAAPVLVVVARFIARAA